MASFVEQYAPHLAGALSGFDRLLFRGTLTRLMASGGLTSYLALHKILLKDFGDYAQTVSKQVRKQAEKAASAAGIRHEYLSSPKLDKEAFAREIAAEQGITQGPVCLLSTLEVGNSFSMPSEDGRIRPVCRPRKFLHLYRYEIHPEVGWMHTRVGTWFPFDVQICLNGREWLARQLDRAGLTYERRDNCFLQVEDFAQAQALADQQLTTDWPVLLDGMRRALHPLHEELFQQFSADYYWTTQQCEWATDLVFRDPAQLRHLFPLLTRYAINELSCGDVLRYFGYRVCTGERPGRSFPGEIVSHLKEWAVGTRVKHRAYGNGLKLYDKAYSDGAAVLRAEFTTNRVRGFKVFRPHRETGELTWQPMRKTVADLHRLAQISQSATTRYLNAFAAVEDVQTLEARLAPVTQPTELDGRRVRALRPHDPADMALLRVVQRGEWAGNGFRNKDLRPLLWGDEASLAREEVRRRSGRMTRQLRLLRAHGLIRKVPHTHRYLVTEKGREVITALLAAERAPVRELLALAA
jgi:hypothetical protein